MAFVLDASVAMAWCFEDESSPYAEHVLEMSGEHDITVPGVWPLEVANALWAAERRGRITLADSLRFSELLQGLAISVDNPLLDRALGSTLSLARTHDLSVYDASYLELVIREDLPLATLDDRLREAARKAGAQVVA